MVFMLACINRLNGPKQCSESEIHNYLPVRLVKGTQDSIFFFFFFPEVPPTSHLNVPVGGGCLYIGKFLGQRFECFLPF